LGGEFHSQIRRFDNSISKSKDREGESQTLCTMRQGEADNAFFDLEREFRLKRNQNPHGGQ